MTRLVLVLLRAYLGLFAVFVHDREHARREHSLLEGSLRESYDDGRARGSGRARAVGGSVWEHLGELQPLALFLKTRADAAYAPGGGRRDRVCLLLVVVVAATVVSPVAALLLGPATVTVARLGLPLLGLVTFVAAAVAGYRRSHDRWLIALAVAAGGWPFLPVLLFLVYGPLHGGYTLYAAVLTAALLAAALWRAYHRRSTVSFAMIGAAPLGWQLFLSLRIGVLNGDMGTQESYAWPRSLVADGALTQGELIALAAATAMALYLSLLALALLSLSGGRREAPGGREHRIASS